MFLFLSLRDVLCGLLLCANLTERPKFGDLQGKLTSLTIHHQNRYMDCRWSGFFNQRTCICRMRWESMLKFGLLRPSVFQGRSCSAGWWSGSGLRGGRDAMWAKHDVFGAPLPPRHNLQPQLVSGLLVLTRLLPPRGESVFSRHVFTFCEVVWRVQTLSLKLSCRFVAMRWSASVMLTTPGRIAVCSTLFLPQPQTMD